MSLLDLPTTLAAAKQNPAISYMAEAWDSGDLWGSAMSTAFAMCDRMFAIGNASHIPATMGYRPSAAGAEYHLLCEGLAVDRVFGDLDIERALPLLDDLIVTLDEMGLSY